MRQEGTLKPEAFVPHPHAELSVTRLREATECEVWAVGYAIEKMRSHALRCRGDVEAHTFAEHGLELKADPILDESSPLYNPNHANATGWPKGDKGRQKLIAAEIALNASVVQRPRGL